MMNFTSPIQWSPFVALEDFRRSSWGIKPMQAEDWYTAAHKEWMRRQKTGWSVDPPICWADALYIALFDESVGALWAELTASDDSYIAWEKGLELFVGFGLSSSKIGVVVGHYLSPLIHENKTYFPSSLTYVALKNGNWRFPPPQPPAQVQLNLRVKNTGIDSSFQNVANRLWRFSNWPSKWQNDDGPVTSHGVSWIHRTGGGSQTMLHLGDGVGIKTLKR